MGKKGHKKKFTPFVVHEEKNEVNNTYSPDARPSHSGNTYSSSSSSGWSNKTYNTPREDTGNWRTDSIDFPQRRDATDFPYRRDNSDLPHRRNNTDLGRRNTTSRNLTSEWTGDVRKEDLTDSIVENSEQEKPSTQTPIPWCDQVEPTSIDTEISNLSVEDTSEVDMRPQQANSSWSGSNNTYGKSSTNTRTSQGDFWRNKTDYSIEDSNIAHGKGQSNTRSDGEDWRGTNARPSERTRYSEGTRPSERQNGKSQRYRNENYDANIERNWRIKDNTGRNNDDRARASRTDVHQTTEDRSKTYESERRPNINRDSPKEGPKTSPGNFYRRRVFYDNEDEEKNKFVSYLDSKDSENYTKVQEEERNLFGVEKDYALAHCVAEDMNMGSGIAVEFRVRFKKVPELLDQYAQSGGLATLKIGDQYIYYLVTKAVSKGKPSYDTLWSSIIKLRTHMKTNGVKKVAMPRIGCGLDRLDWNIVKPMLEFIFKDEDLDVLVCNLQVEPTNTPYVKRCKIVYETKAITEIEPQTIIIYFASKDGKPTDTMTNLDKKFFLASQFQRAPKNVGEAIRLVPNNIKNYILYGCIIKDKDDDPFGFVAFEKCLRTIIKNYKTDNLFYVAFQKLAEEGLNDKILNLMKHSLSDVEIYVCGCSESVSNVEE